MCLNFQFNTNQEFWREGILAGKSVCLHFSLPQTAHDHIHTHMYTPQRKQDSALRFLSLELEVRQWTSAVLAASKHYRHLAPSLLRIQGQGTPELSHNASPSVLSLEQLLQDGTILCALVNSLYELLVAPYSFLSIVDASLHSYLRVENLTQFLNSCELHFGLKQRELFHISDLLSDNRKNIVRVVYCLCSLSMHILANDEAKWRTELVQRLPKWPKATTQDLFGFYTAEDLQRTSEMLKHLGTHFNLNSLGLAPESDRRNNNNSHTYYDGKKKKKKHILHCCHVVGFELTSKSFYLCLCLSNRQMVATASTTNAGVSRRDRSLPWCRGGDEERPQRAARGGGRTARRAIGRLALAVDWHRHVPLLILALILILLTCIHCCELSILSLQQQFVDKLNQQAFFFFCKTTKWSWWWWWWEASSDSLATVTTTNEIS